MTVRSQGGVGLPCTILIELKLHFAPSFLFQSSLLFHTSIESYLVIFMNFLHVSSFLSLTLSLSTLISFILQSSEFSRTFLLSCATLSLPTACSLQGTEPAFLAGGKVWREFQLYSLSPSFDCCASAFESSACGKRTCNK